MNHKLIIAVVFFLVVISVVAVLSLGDYLNKDIAEISFESSKSPASSLSVSDYSSTGSKIISKNTSSSVASNEGGNLIRVNPDVILNMEKIMELPNNKIGWGSGYGKNNAQPPISSKTKKLFESYNACCIGSKDSKKNYLTFDEGYENGYTKKILDTLKEKEVKAVFFVTKSYVTKNKVLVKRMIDEGHIVGNHSTKHKLYPDLTVNEVREDVLNLHSYMLEEFDYEMFLFRFPNGEYSERSLEILKQLGYTSVFWSFAYKDYDVNTQLGTEYAYNKVIDNAHNGAIYLLHAVSKDNANALSMIIDTLTEKGYELALLSGIPE